MARRLFSKLYLHRIYQRFECDSTARTVYSCRCLRMDRGYSTTTHYDTLGVGRNAKSSEIKKAYIEKTKTYHPDVIDSNDADEFLKISEAYQVLSDTRTRREYDFQEFGMSSQHNRFETGEYKIPVHDSAERKERYERMKKRKQPKTETDSQQPVIKMGLTGSERKILDYLMGTLISICIAMYLLSRYQRRNSKEENDDCNEISNGVK